MSGGNCTKNSPEKAEVVHEEKAWLSIQPGFFIVKIIAAS
jgi:hypothetical protein